MGWVCHILLFSNVYILLSLSNHDIKVDTKAEAYLRPYQICMNELFFKRTSNFKTLTVFSKNLHHGCLIMELDVVWKYQQEIPGDEKIIK